MKNCSTVTEAKTSSFVPKIGANIIAFCEHFSHSAINAAFIDHAVFTYKLFIERERERERERESERERQTERERDAQRVTLIQYSVPDTQYSVPDTQYSIPYTHYPINILLPHRNAVCGGAFFYPRSSCIKK
jgi:hypothetical protein